MNGHQSHGNRARYRAIAEQRLARLGGGGDAPADHGAARAEPVVVGSQQKPRRHRLHAAAARYLAGRPATRIVPHRRAVLGIAAVSVAATLVLGWQLVRHRPRDQTLPAASVGVVLGSSTTPGPGPGASARSSVLVVDVVGKVRRPGLVRLSSGARVDDAIRAAGGALPGTDLSNLNLARLVADGEQIAVGIPGVAAPPASAGGGPAGGPPSAGLVNLNTASAEQLDALPGVGPVLAQRIVDWRTEHGRFASIDQLREVSGIGESKFAQLRSRVTV